MSSFILSFSQNNLITVVATGEGVTESQAINRALRNAIEKTFGVFISASTVVKNDELISDDIATISSGNIASYDIISTINNGSSFVVSVKALVSPEKVVLSLKNAGKQVELNGSVFAQNILAEKFYKDQEVAVIRDFIASYKNLNVIDSFGLYICPPFFMNFPDNGNSYKISEFIRDNFGPSRVSEIVKSSICFDGLTKDLQGNQYPSDPYNKGKDLRSHYIPKYASINSLKQLLLFKDGEENKLFFSGMQNDWPRVDKNLKDMSGGNYILPIIYKPIYNVNNAVKLTSAIVNLLNVISIKDVDDYTKKLGQSFPVIFIGLDKPRPGIVRFTDITNSSSKSPTRIPFYEVTLKNYTTEFSLRNAESINLLKAYFDTQFYRSSPDNMYINSNTEFSKILHLMLTHERLKVRASFQNYQKPLGIDITPNITSATYGTIENALYPSVVLFRLSLEDLEKLKSVDFSFEK